ncbi:Methyltransferase type 11 [Penicillium atrosanguineum]|uniref:Uncharacterized protein n=1 Tax=Penicillium atrosanguineum TaxID=1132637 RepID=A0A9W9PSD9_9EURO|nr:Methyltransferase type 11 [Penicillium atrosanguineum]KAJ5137266.1 hypothetical protein N7526_003499 [Penicillium atrosanguineum]KAJ5290187.1 Methyltransferase type 11 [Penicillium atrosanguineum]KAJ5308011.1 hypothetical protein N7476_008667 [Penicillium atrosanguineum]
MDEKDESAVFLAPTCNDKINEAPPTPEGPTDSHVLAQVEQDEKGLSQQAGDTAEVTDVGWTTPTNHIVEPIIAGISNEDLWMLIRRFDQQVYNVKAVPNAPLQNLDLTRSDDDEFSPDKLRATMERFYITVVVTLTSFIKHVARLRSWKEPRRTAIFCVVYSLAWVLDFLAPAFFAALISLVIYPPCRPIMFPPAPIALVDKDTGGVQKPKAGVLGSHDSITGAPEKYKGEAAEKEASNLVASVASVAVGSAVGKHDQGVPEGAPLEDSVPDAMDIVSNTADAQSAAQGEIPSESHDKTRQPMKQAVLDGANMAMDVVSDITDTFEKFGNALSPTSPFPQLSPRLRLVAVLAPTCLLSTLVSSYFLMKTMGLVTGFVFFGDPIIWRGIAYLNSNYPHWERLLELQNSLLKGIPTNSQLALTLLRIGEANMSPLPPPPSSLEKASSRPASLHHEELTLGASRSEIELAASPEVHNGLKEEEPHHEKTMATRILGFFRGTTATGVESKRGIDRMRAAIGSRHARNRVGVLRPKGKESSPVGPAEFNARHKGKRGAVVIDSSKDSPILYFTTDIPQFGDFEVEKRKKGTVYFTIPVSDILEMKKQGGMGWKGKLVVGWAIGSKEVVDGLLIQGKEPHQTYQLTAMGTRNQLFNRLIAIDGQVWETF